MTTMTTQQSKKANTNITNWSVILLMSNAMKLRYNHHETDYTTEDVHPVSSGHVKRNAKNFRISYEELSD